MDPDRHSAGFHFPELLTPPDLPVIRLCRNEM